MADLKTDWLPGTTGLTVAVNEAAEKVNDLDALTATGRLSEPALSSMTGAQIQEAVRVVDVLAAGAKGDGVTDDSAIVAACIAAAGPHGIVYFPTKKGAAETVYRLSTLQNLTGSQIRTDPGVVLKMNPLPSVKDWNLLTPVTIDNTSHVTKLRKDPAAAIENIGAFMAANVQEQPLSLTPLDFTTFTRFGSNSVNNGNIGGLTLKSTVAAGEVSWATAFDTGVVHEGVAFAPIIGQYYEAFIETTYTGAGQRAAISALTAAGIHCSAGVSNNASLGSFQGSSTFGKTSGTIQLAPGLGVYSLPTTTGGVTLGFRLLSNREIEYYSNGRYIARQTMLQDIDKVGWSISSTSPTLTKISLGLGYGPGYVPKSSSQYTVSLVGDSNTYGAWSATNWADLLPIALHGLPGGGGVQVRQNLAVSGTKAQDWATAGGQYDIAAKSFTGDDYVLVMLGTNDGSARATSAFLADLTYIANKIIADGARPVFGIFPLWTNQAVSGVVGVTPAAPSQVQRLRHAELNWCATNGYPVALIEGALGDNIRMLSDNIHVDVRGAAYIAKAFAQAMSRDRVKLIA